MHGKIGIYKFGRFCLTPAEKLLEKKPPKPVFTIPKAGTKIIPRSKS